MKKESKNIMELTKKGVGSLPIHLRVGTKRLVSLIEADKLGLIAGQVTTALMCPLYLVLNSTLFLGEEL